MVVVAEPSLAVAASLLVVEPSPIAMAAAGQQRSTVVVALGRHSALRAVARD